MLTEANRQMVIDNKNLADAFVRKQIKQHKIPSYLIDDFKSDINLSLCNSVIKYDFSTKNKFSTYAYSCFKMRLKDIYVKKYELCKKNDFVIALAAKKNSRSITEKEQIYFLIENSKLTKKEKDILFDYFFDMSTMEKIGEKNGVSKQRIKQIIEVIILKLRETSHNKNLKIEDFFR